LQSLPLTMCSGWAKEPEGHIQPYPAGASRTPQAWRTHRPAIASGRPQQVQATNGSFRR
jgi:hypothetical protein